MEFFSTPELLEIGGHPLATTPYKPRREEAIDYYRSVAQREGLDVRLGERAWASKASGAIHGRHVEGEHPARAVVVASGFFDQPNLARRRGRGPPPRLALLQGALPVQRATRRGSAPRTRREGRPGDQPPRRRRHARRPRRRDHASVKYWIRPDLVNRIAEGAIEAHYHTTVEGITPEAVHVPTPEGRRPRRRRPRPHGLPPGLLAP